MEASFMRANLPSLGFVITLLSALSASMAHAQVTIDVSKVTCDQFAQSKMGEPRTTAIWLNGYYHGKNGSTTIDTQQSEAIFGELIDFCRTGENGKVLVMQALERLMKRK
jgi:acid stress chaperone HdeB